MRTGIVVDGRAEPQAIQLMLGRLSGLGKVLRPRYADIQPKDRPGHMAAKAMPRVRELICSGADRVILLIDREDREECPASFARAIEDALRKLGAAQVQVVVKDRTVENWLIADPDALVSLGKRFCVSKAFRARVVPNKADHVVDAAALLSQVRLGASYEKGEDPARIMEVLDVAAAARNSRSLRRFLRVLGWAGYRDQSKRP